MAIFAAANNFCSRGPFSKILLFWNPDVLKNFHLAGFLQVIFFCPIPECTTTHRILRVLVTLDFCRLVSTNVPRYPTYVDALSDGHVGRGQAGMPAAVGMPIVYLQ
jgi:hypothetical protein